MSQICPHLDTIDDARAPSAPRTHTHAQPNVGGRPSAAGPVVGRVPGRRGRVGSPTAGPARRLAPCCSGRARSGPVTLVGPMVERDGRRAR